MIGGALNAVNQQERGLQVPTKYQYYNNCTSWKKGDVGCDGGLSDMIDSAIEITRRTFLKHVDRDDLRDLGDAFGYSEHHSRGLTMARDWHITYCRGKLHGRRAYYFVHSAIEYVFTN